MTQDMGIYMEAERLILRSWKPEDRIPFAEMNGNPEEFIRQLLSISPEIRYCFDG